MRIENWGYFDIIEETKKKDFFKLSLCSISEALIQWVEEKILKAKWVYFGYFKKISKAKQLPESLCQYL